MSSLSTKNFKTIIDQITSYSPEDKLLDFLPPKELEKILEENMLNQHQHSSAVQTLENNVEFVLKHSVNTSHSMFVNQLYGGPNPTGLIGAILVEKMNTNQHTYEVAPVFVLAERIILRHLRYLFFGSEEGDGIFCPGGSFANLYGLIMARHRKFPEIKRSGIFGHPTMVIFSSTDAHYSISKMANWMGLGEDNVVKIQTNRQGAMIPSKLESAIFNAKSEGKIPLAVVATIGTTVLGGFDPLDDIAAICAKEGIWLHCDAAWGGSFIFSDKLKSKWLQGINKCDSIVWNAHKMLGAPLQCTAFITKEIDVLASCNSVAAPYLFQTNKHYDESYDDSGQKSVQCGRKPDAFKLWLMWTTLGIDTFREVIEQTEDCASYFAQTIRNREGFRLYLDSGHQCTNIFFWYIPVKLRSQAENDTWWEEVGKVTVNIRTKLLLGNKVFIGYAPLPHKKVPNAFRLVLTAYPLHTRKDMDVIIENIEAIGQNL